jgi:hypothetical protein
MHHSRHINGSPFHGVDQAIRNTFGEDSAETGLSEYAKFEGVVELDRRPNQQHQGIPGLVLGGNLRRILQLDGFLG